MPGLTPFKTVKKLLATLTSLKCLDLSKNMLGDEGATELAGVLGKLSTLEKLDLGGKNNIGAEGCRALALKFSKLPALKELLLPNNHMGEKGCEALTKGLTTMTSLQILDLTGNFMTLEGPKDFEHLGTALGKLQELHTLRLGNMNIDGDSMVELWLKAGPSLSRGFMATYPETGGRLLRLYLQRNGFHTKGCVALAKVLPCLPLLEILDVRNNDINAEGIEPIAAALIGMPVKELKLAENDLRSAGVCKLAGVLHSMPNLQTLDLDNNHFGSDGAEELAKCLPETVCHLRLAGNKVRNKGVIALASALHTLPLLKELILEENEVSDEGVQALADNLKNCSSLVYLNLISNRIGDSGCKALTEAVSKTACFQKLHLGENSIGEIGCMAMASALSSLTALKELDLGGNRICPEACAVLLNIARKMPEIQGLAMRLEDQAEEDDHSEDEDDDMADSEFSGDDDGESDDDEYDEYDNPFFMM